MNKQIAEEAFIKILTLDESKGGIMQTIAKRALTAIAEPVAEKRGDPEDPRTWNKEYVIRDLLNHLAGRHDLNDFPRCLARARELAGLPTAPTPPIEASEGHIEKCDCDSCRDIDGFNVAAFFGKSVPKGEEGTAREWLRAQAEDVADYIRDTSLQLSTTSAGNKVATYRLCRSRKEAIDKVLAFSADLLVALAQSESKELS